MTTTDMHTPHLFEAYFLYITSQASDNIYLDCPQYEIWVIKAS